jgi:hypothetical protein
VGLRAIDGQALQRLFSCGLGNLARAILAGDGPFEQAAKLFR